MDTKLPMKNVDSCFSCILKTWLQLKFLLNFDHKRLIKSTVKQAVALLYKWMDNLCKHIICYKSKKELKLCSLKKTTRKLTHKGYSDFLLRNYYSWFQWRVRLSRNGQNMNFGYICIQNQFSIIKWGLNHVLIMNNEG